MPYDRDGQGQGGKPKNLDLKTTLSRVDDAAKYQVKGARKFRQKVMSQGAINFDASKYQQLLPSPPTTYTMNDFYKKIV